MSKPKGNMITANAHHIHGTTSPQIGLHIMYLSDIRQDHRALFILYTYILYMYTPPDI